MLCAPSRAESIPFVPHKVCIMSRLWKNSHSHRIVATAGCAPGVGLTVPMPVMAATKRQAIVGTAHRDRNEAAAVPRHHNHGARGPVSGRRRTLTSARIPRPAALLNGHANLRDIPAPWWPHL